VPEETDQLPVYKPPDGPETMFCSWGCWTQYGRTLSPEERSHVRVGKKQLEAKSPSR
jgi:hypothetical protein